MFLTRAQGRSVAVLITYQNKKSTFGDIQATIGFGKSRAD